MIRFALLVIVGLSLVGCGLEKVPLPTSDPQPTSNVSEPIQPPTPSALPKHISIPDIDAESSLIETGLNPDRSIETPPVESPKQASWYNLSPRPGDVGPSIVLGHVDGRGQRGVFYRLKNLKRGSLVHIDRRDGSRVSFEVYEVSSFPKKRFPTDRVYGNTDSPELRLISCGGAFGNAEPGHYDDNLKAFARMV
jgi:sortase (surface protein transpeptidase)